METTDMPANWGDRLDIVLDVSLPAAAELADRWLARAINIHLAELLELAGKASEAASFRQLDVDALKTIPECVALLDAARASVEASQLWATEPFAPRIRCARSALSLAHRILETQVLTAATMQERARHIALLAIFTAVRVDQSRNGSDELPAAAPVARAELDVCVREASDAREA
jgi:hypothetical protein